jgi:hypothetical protein
MRKRDAASSPDVLWIYRDPAIKPGIERLIAGTGNEAETLGYPVCCINSYRDIAARMTEQLVSGYKKQYGAKSVRDLIRCSEQDLRVSLDSSIDTGDEASKQRFPFVQFIACHSCINGADSPAAQINNRFWQLARDVDEKFSKEIERTVAPSLAMTLDNHIFQERIARASQSLLAPAIKPTTRIGRNDPCPCGSGLKFKKCHGRRT